MKKWSLKGKKAFITGGTKGIGLEIVSDFLKLGAEVITISRSEDNVALILDRFKGENLEAFVCDVSLKESRQEVIRMLGKKLQKLDILVNNAGTNIRKKSFDYSEEEIRQLFELNYFATVDFCRGLLPLLRLSDGGSIVNISSVASMIDVGTGFPYASAKSAMNQFTKSLAAEWGIYKIRVNAVLPWFIKTPLTEGYLADEDRYQKIIKRTPLNRVGTPDEVSALVTFLAMDISSYITGQTIAVDGGVMASVFGE